MDRNSPFTVDQLRAERVGGGGPNLTYALTSASVSPTLRVGTDKFGMPVEETVPTVYSKLFVGLDGCIRNVPLRTASVFSSEPEAERYETQTTKELVLSGVFPVEVCPHGGDFRHWTKGPLVPAPPGVTACDGSPKIERNTLGQIISGGCEHMQALIKLRRERAKDVHDALHRDFETMSDKKAKQLMELAGEAFGKAAASMTSTTKKAAARMAEDKPDA